MTQTTTGVKKKKKDKKEDDDDITGPKIRHPSSNDVYLNIIFLNEKYDQTKLSNAAKLYQDILGYSLTNKYHNNDLQKQQQPQQERRGFKITEIGHWLLDNNKDYIDYYTDFKSKIPKGRRLNDISKRIKRYIDNLEKWRLISKLDQVDTNARNGQKIWIYDYTDFGYIIAWILEYHYKSVHIKQIAKNKIFELIQHQFKAFNSHIMDFLARLYEKFKEYDNNDNADEKKNNNRYGFLDALIDLMISILKDEKSSKGLNAMECFSKSQEMLLRRPQSLKLYFETLNEFSEDVRKQIIQQEKCVLEYNMLISQPPKDWQKIWFDNINKYDKIILYGKCQNKECSSHGPVIYDYYGYRKAISQSTDNRYSKTKCTQCNAENALHVYYSMDNFDI